MAKKWTKEEDELLEILYKENKSNKKISEIMGRTICSINGRISKLRLTDKYKRLKYEDLTGRVFGRLTVLRRVEDRIEPSGKKKLMWECICSCQEHNIIIVSGDNLRCGTTKSCGCYQIERARESSIKRNEFKIFNDVVFVKYTNCNEYFICDLEDWDKLKDFCWEKHAGYAVTKVKNKHVRFHCELINKLPKELQVDHWKQVSLGVCDNRKKNLRVVTYQENSRNQKLRSNNTSGFTGVIFDKRNQKWYSQIKVDYKTIFLGYYDNKIGAIKARLQAEHDICKEFSSQWHLFKEYGIDDSDLDYWSVTLANPEVQKKYGYKISHLKSE